MFEKEYEKMNEKIYADNGLNEAVFKKIAAPKHIRLRPLVTVAAVLLVLLIAVPVMAYYVPPINDLMFFVAPQMAQRFSPIQESCERNGILVEIISASIHENVAEICISIDDVTADRITEDTIADDFRIRGIESFGQSTKSLCYDEDNGKHILLITTKALTYDTMAHYGDCRRLA